MIDCTNFWKLIEIIRENKSKNGSKRAKMDEQNTNVNRHFDMSASWKLGIFLSEKSHERIVNKLICHEQVMSKSQTSHEQGINNSWTRHEQFKSKPLTSHQKWQTIINNLKKSHEQVIKLCEQQTSHGQVMQKMINKGQGCEEVQGMQWSYLQSMHKSWGVSSEEIMNHSWTSCEPTMGESWKNYELLLNNCKKCN